MDFSNNWAWMFKFVFPVMKIEYYSLVIAIKVWVLVKLIKSSWNWFIIKILLVPSPGSLLSVLYL